MTRRQKLEIRLSEVRGRLNEIADLEGDALTDEIRAEADGLRTEYADLETRFQAAVTAEAAEEAEAGGLFGPGDGEPAERRRLFERATVGAYLRHAHAGSGVAGAEAELSASLEVPTIGLGGGVAIPWQLIARGLVDDPSPATVPAEARAATTTGELAGPVMQRPILQRLFGRDIFDALGVRIDSVPQGQAQWPLLTNGVAPTQKAEEAAADAAVAATFDTQTLRPKRLTGRYEYTVEQAAEVPDLEQALRRDIADAVRAEMCDQLLNGTGAGAQVTGFYNRLAAPNPAPAAIATFAGYAGTPASAVDGIHAGMESEVGCVFGVATYQHAAGTYRDAAGDESAVEVIKRRSRMVMASSFVPAVAATVQNGNILHAGADPMRGDSIAAMWPTLEVIRDIYTKAAEGTVALTWVSLWNVYAAFRQGAYKRVSFKLA